MTKTIRPIILTGLMLLTHSALATPLTFSAGSQADFDAATRCIFGGTGPGGCPILAGSSGSAPAPTPTGGSGSYSGDSWTYTVDELITALGGDNTFNLVFDSNWSNSTPGDSDFLDLFQVYVNGVVAFDYTVSGTPMDSGANGNGNENWVLSTVDLSGFLLTDEVYFHLEMSGLTDGFEQVALFGAGFVPPTPMPEPKILLLLGTGLLGLAIGRRRTSR